MHLVGVFSRSIAVEGADAEGVAGAGLQVSEQVGEGEVGVGLGVHGVSRHLRLRLDRS